ncbi:MAG: protein phosphatase 2C domain-containing protein [Chthoniobacterales bacterium]|nr:protein phosphatase 2C domain-containing protein [Chthoniobacterales bacterium]
MLEEEKQWSLSWSGYSDCGRFRQNNEDAFLGLSIDAQEVHYLGKQGTTFEKKDYVFAVCDGIGGAMAGEFASRIAVEKITKMFPSFLAKMTEGEKKGSVPGSRDPGTDPFFDEEEEKLCFQLLVQLFHEIHRTLLFVGSSYQECRGMGTTLTLVWIRSSKNKLYFAHIGDSRLYHFPAAGELYQLSEDDTHVGWLFRQRTLNERESKNHPRRHLLQKALGADHQFVTPQTGSAPCLAGHRFLLSTDGVTDPLFDHQLLELLTLHSTPSSSQHLVEQAFLHSGKDNATAVVISFEKIKKEVSPAVC